MRKSLVKKGSLHPTVGVHGAARPAAAAALPAACCRRRPLHQRPPPPALAPAPHPQPPPPPSRLAFETIYANPRRHKDGSRDGFLLVSSKRIALHDEAGTAVAHRAFRPDDAKTVADGGTFVVGNWECELGAAVPVDRFDSGAVLAAASTGASTVAAAAAGSAARAPFKPVVAGAGARAPFKPVAAGGGGSSAARRLAAAGRPAAAVGNAPAQPHAVVEAIDGDLVLNVGDKEAFPVKVDRKLAFELQAHQREGLQFMYDCVTGRRRDTSGQPLQGCILAHTMGLGKSLQALALVHTLLRGGPRGAPFARKAAIVCPASLVGNWKNEVTKWLGSTKLRPTLLPPSKAAAADAVRDFVHCPPMELLIVSYEGFRTHADALEKANLKLLVCDEGHRLKSGSSKTNQALVAQRHAKRVVLSGTPVQNELEELWHMADFACPGVLGNLSSFRAIWAAPVAAGRQPGADEDVQRVGEARAAELFRKAAAFMQVKDASVLTAALPPRTELVVCCALAPAQLGRYKDALLDYKREARDQGVDAAAGGHRPPRRLFVGRRRRHARRLSRRGRAPRRRLPRRRRAVVAPPPPRAPPPRPAAASEVGKLRVLMALLGAAKAAGDRVVIVAQFKRSLDAIHAALDDRGWGALRLDGSTAMASRQENVDRFNAPGSSHFAFLLSTRAGGTGLNLVSANRLVLYDSDWNPAADAQAMARIYRFGQKRAVTIWRLLSAGTVEEKQYQRQLYKSDATALGGGGGGGSGRPAAAESENKFSQEELKQLFLFREETKCDTLTRLLAANGRSAELSALLDAADWVPLLTDATLRAALDADPALLAMVPFAVGRRTLPRAGRGDAPTLAPCCRVVGGRARARRRRRRPRRRLRRRGV